MPRVSRAHPRPLDFFDGPLVPYSDPVTREKIMAILDQRVVMVVFGDNANLSASAAKTIGALLVSELKENSVAGQIRRELEQFLEDQKGGYIHLYDPKVGLFYFGLDATKNRLLWYICPPAELVKVIRKAFR